MSHGSWRGRRLGGCADAETAVEVGAWCAPAHTADRRGPGADEPCVCSQVEAIMATIVSNGEGSPRSRPRSPGVCRVQTRPDLRGNLNAQATHFRIILLI
ncbi:hypothetical protein OAO87_03530 [bacterium]|nr:hypothetical protein [bacterium]